ncbi:MAG: hypothetical protein AAFQ82_00945 [Myxococcota bacterium]
MAPFVRRGVSHMSEDESRSPEAADSLKKLNALFGDSGGSTSSAPSRPRMTARGAPREQVFASPRRSNGRSPTEYRMRLERLRIASSPEEIREAGDAFMTHHQLPDETDVLMKLLRHPEERVVRESLGQLSSLIAQGRLSNGTLLRERLKELEARVQEDATKAYVHGVRDQLERSV